jgi:ABC-type multidrug transport system fused ATPase/permease subunit
VTFHYPNRKKDVAKELSKNSTKEKETRDPALEDVSFTIKSGTTTAFVGKSGSGKTTLINLLLRAYDPQDGTIYIDGVDLKQLKLDSYRKQVGVVEQEVEVFDKTIKHNILFPIDDPEAYDMQQLHEIAHDAGVAEFEDRLEDGYDTKIGEKGIQLSGGQKQRVGIARVLAKKPKILIFDEATASLDSINEKNIHEAMNRALKGRTGIIIAHRLATIMDADKIIVMDNGKVVGEGTHAELLKTCSEYQELVKLQNLN